MEIRAKWTNLLRNIRSISINNTIILIANDLGITNFIIEKINEEIEEYQIEKIQMELPKKYQNIDIILEKPDRKTN